VFTKDGNTIYFTRNNYLEGKRGKKQSRHYFNQNLQGQINKMERGRTLKTTFNSDNISMRIQH
jgi:hypothetical protein